MAYNQENEYIITQDTSNLLENITHNRVRDDKTFVTISGGNVIIEAGSRIEFNGDLYEVTVDESVVHPGTGTKNYILFNSTTGFSISSSKGSFDIIKNGWYNGSDRVLKWAIVENDSGYVAYIDSEILLEQDKPLVVDANSILDSGDWIQIANYTTPLPSNSFFIKKPIVLNYKIDTGGAPKGIFAIKLDGAWNTLTNFNPGANLGTGIFMPGEYRFRRAGWFSIYSVYGNDFSTQRDIDIDLL